MTFLSARETSNQSYETPATALSRPDSVKESSSPREPVIEADSANGR